MRVKIIDKNNKNPKVYIDGIKLRRNNKDESSRVLFFSKDYVVKMEEAGSYLSQCSFEKRNWRKLEKKYAEFFVPTLKYGMQRGWEYVVQPRIRFKSTRVLEHEKLDFLVDILEKYDICDCEGGYNIGVTKDNKILCYDYGV